MRCTRCGKRCRNNIENWNVDYIASMLVGIYCPNCQSTEDDLEAQVNQVLNPPSSWKHVMPPRTRDSGEAINEYVATLIDGLIKTYRTPETLRHKASMLEAARNDERAAQMVWLMHSVADDLESGAISEVEP